MNLSLLELQRARKQLQVYCDQRNRGTHPVARWSTREVGHCFIISREGGFDAQGRALPDITVLKICYQEPGWELLVPQGTLSRPEAIHLVPQGTLSRPEAIHLVPQARGDWVPYAPRPRVERFEQILEELDQAPLHIHW